jgi:hypothetical protein
MKACLLPGAGSLLAWLAQTPKFEVCDSEKTAWNSRLGTDDSRQ